MVRLVSALLLGVGVLSCMGVDMAMRMCVCMRVQRMGDKASVGNCTALTGMPVRLQWQLAVPVRMQGDRSCACCCQRRLCPVSLVLILTPGSLRPLCSANRYGFNPGSNLMISTEVAAVTVSRVAVTTTLSASAGGISVLFYKYFRHHVWDTSAVCNGVLGGLVAITGPCAVVEPWAALICGFCAGLFMYFGEWFILHICKIDDPVSAIAVHGFCGMFGVFFTGLMAKPFYVAEVYGGYSFKDSYTEKR